MTSQLKPAHQPETEALTPAFRRVGVLYHPKLPETRVSAADILEFIEGAGTQAWVSASWDQSDATLLKIGQSDLLVTLGGDGSLLRVARLASSGGIPIIGINFGRLGFLAEVQPAEWRDSLSQILRGEFWIEERLMVQTRCLRQGQVMLSHEALNDVVISRGSLARVVRLATYVDGGYMTTYVADGLIIATPTGSTAYALAAGGPILPPELKNFLIVPLAPHLSLERAIVLSRGARVRVRVKTDHSAILTVDGQFEVDLEDGDDVEILASERVARFVRLHERAYFYRTLTNRLGWPGARGPEARGPEAGKPT